MAYIFYLIKKIFIFRKSQSVSPIDFDSKGAYKDNPAEGIGLMKMTVQRDIERTHSVNSSFRVKVGRFFDFGKPK